MNISLSFSNIVDRVVVGGVVDYITVYFGPQSDRLWSLSWNISDLVINVAVVYIFLGSYKLEQFRKEDELEKSIAKSD